MKANSRFLPLASYLPLAAVLALGVPAAAAPRAAERSGAIQNAAASQAAQAVQPRLTGHIPLAAVAHAHLVGRVAAAQTVGLALTLPLRNQAALSDLLSRLYTPGDPQYGKFLSPAEFADRFGPTESDYAAVTAAAKSAGLQITGTHPNRLILDVSGPASAVESAFGLRLQNYRAADGRLFRAPDAGPLLPRGMAGRVAAIVGLDTALRLHSHLRPRLVPSALSDHLGSGPEQGLAPSDVKTAYSLNSLSANGSGQSIALFELDGYTASDITTYRSYFNLPAMPIQNILVDGTTGAVGDSSDETTLDIELAQALAPNLSKILLYLSPDTNPGVIDTFNRIVSDNSAKQISTSFGEDEISSGSAFLAQENPIFQEMAAQGQTMLSASGDYGAYDNGTTLTVDDPGSQPYVTDVGGTTLATSGTGGPYASESAWGLFLNVNDPNSTGGSDYGVGGGGGFSAVWPTPSYQTALVPAPAMRSVPDVALNSDPENGYSIYVGGQWNVYGGTSAAAPLWAGFTALVNQQRAAAGKAPVGFLNPTIYQIGANAVYDADFHDVISGNNLFYPAIQGYDNATGWGSFIGSALLNTLVSGLPSASPATVTGTVAAADTNAPLPNVTVRAVSFSGAATVSTTTNASGVYTLPVVTGQNYSILADAYAATNGAYAGARVTADASVLAGQSQTQNLSVLPAHTYAPGLQMISSPYSDSPPSDFQRDFGLTAPAAPLVTWDPLGFGYVFYPMAPATSLTIGMGYWTIFSAPAYMHYPLRGVSTSQPYSLFIQAGWNMIADPFAAAVSLSGATFNSAALIGSPVSPTLYTYNTATGQYDAVTAPNGSLQPYTGYWVYASRQGSLTLPAP